MRNLCAMILILTLCSGCAQMTFTRKEEEASSSARIEFPVSSLVWGFTPLTTPPGPESLCARSRVDSVQIEMNSADVFLALITFGFYVPQRVIVVCQ